MHYCITMDDGSQQVLDSLDVVRASTSHGTATRWEDMAVGTLARVVHRINRNGNGPVLLHPGIDQRHSIASVVPVGGAPREARRGGVHARRS